MPSVTAGQQAWGATSPEWSRRTESFWGRERVYLRKKSRKDRLLDIIEKRFTISWSLG